MFGNRILTVVNFQTVFTSQSDCCHAGMHAIERAGRRKLLLVSMTGVLCTLVALSAAFRISERSTSPVIQKIPDFLGLRCLSGGATCASCIHQGCTFCASSTKAHRSGQPGLGGYCLSLSSRARCEARRGYEAYVDGCPSQNSWLLLGLVMAYLLAFSVGVGPVPWAVNSEIYALRFRGTANGIAGTVNWLANGLVSQSFLLLVHALHAWGAFTLLSAIAAAGALWVFWNLPETKGLHLCEVQSLFAERLARPGWRWRATACRPPAEADTVPLYPSGRPIADTPTQLRQSQGGALELDRA